jgi:hypothetical protein
MSGGELWFVKLPNGDVHHVTIDQLDTAFDAGHIDADTLVLPDGSTHWVRLGQAAGLDDAQPSAPPMVSPTPAPVMVPVRVAAPVVSRPPPSSYTPYATPAGSIRPVALDMGSDLDFDDAPFKRSGSRKGWVVAVMSLALMGGGVGYAATHGIALPLPGGGSSNVAAAAAVPMALPVAPAPVPAPAPAAPPVTQTTQAPLAGTLPSMDSALNPRFTVAQKDALLKADKVHDDQAKSRQAAHYAPHAKYKSSSTFTKGGNKYDPLNSDL